MAMVVDMDASEAVEHPSELPEASGIEVSVHAQTDTSIAPGSHQQLTSRRRRYLRIPRRLPSTLTPLLLPFASATPISSPLRTPPPSASPLVARGQVTADNYAHAAMMGSAPANFVILDQMFTPGFIVLSYLIAVIGSLCTLELLIRRTSNAGWRNKLLLTSAGICFGAVSTFSMHFVFNNALTLSHPDVQNGASLHLAYSPGYTVLSLVASCMAMTVAFFVMGTSVAEWYCIPGSRERRAKRRQEKRKNGDEYRRWKLSQKAAQGDGWKDPKEAFKKGSQHLGEFVKRVGTVAKWSMMEHGLNRTSIDDYNKPSEQDFRLGKTRKMAEFDATNDAIQLEPQSLTGGLLDGSKRSSLIIPASSERSVRPMPSDPAFGSWAKYTAQGNGHSTQPSLTDPTEVFASNYNFPPRPESAASLIVRATPSPTGSPSSMHPPYSVAPPGMPPPAWTRRQSIAVEHPGETPIFATDFAPRRASLPAITPFNDSLPTHQAFAAPQSLPYNQARLSRIQSVPEIDATPLSPKLLHSPEVEKGDLYSPKLTATMTLGSHVSTEKKNYGGRAKAYRPIERFLGFDVVTLEDVWKIVLTGTIAGTGVAGMHYIGQLSIVGMPYIRYDPGYVVGSVVIACGAVVIALYIMFIMLRPKLKHHFLYKLCVAFILAIAVCCMHFCGMMGTMYAWPLSEPVTKQDLLKGTNGGIVGTVSALAFAACMACGVFFLIEAFKARRERARRRRVVVAAIMLDEYDRVLVNSTDGLPPMCDIASLSGNDTKSSKSTSAGTQTDGTSTLIGMDLSPGHEAFISALKLSWFWRNPEYSPTVSTLNHDTPVTVSMDATLNEIRRGSFQTATTSLTSVSRPTKVTVQRFLEKFVASSGQLASRLTGHTEGIQRIGVLYDQILTTGWVKLHNSSDTVSKGQLIILVRRVTSQAERDDLLTRHFIFAESSAVAQSLQKTLSVPLEHVSPLLQDVKLFCDSTARVSLQPGTLYAGVAVVQATPFDGLRILLEQNNRSQIPMRELCTFAANPSKAGLTPTELGGTVEEIGEALTWLEGMSLVSIINRNMTSWRNGPTPAVGIGGPRVTALLQALERAIVPMLDEMLNAADMEHVIPRLSLHPLLVPLTPGTHRPDPRNTYVPPYAIVLYANYDAAVNTFTDRWLPFSLFRAQNACVMARSIGVAAKLEEEARRAQVGSPHPLSITIPNTNPYSMQSQSQSQPLQPLSPTSPTHPSVAALQLQASGEYNWSRRPSRVQFEDEVDQLQVSHHPSVGGPGSALGQGLYTPNPSAQSYPRRSSLAKSALKDHGAATVNSPLAGGNTGYSINTSGKVQSPLPLTVPLPNPNERWSELEPVPGVASWEADWLLVLLRTKLRADA